MPTVQKLGAFGDFTQKLGAFGEISHPPTSRRGAFGEIRGCARPNAVVYPGAVGVGALAMSRDQG
jgi:hypothetical protein